MEIQQPSQGQTCRTTALELLADAYAFGSSREGWAAAIEDDEDDDDDDDEDDDDEDDDNEDDKDDDDDDQDDDNSDEGDGYSE
jgi:hypothetical protein